MWSPKFKAGLSSGQSVIFFARLLNQDRFGWTQKKLSETVQRIILRCWNPALKATSKWLIKIVWFFNVFQDHLKAILRDICIYNKTNPHKNMWELKPEYRHYDKKENVWPCWRRRTGWLPWDFKLDTCCRYLIKYYYKGSIL